MKPLTSYTSKLTHGQAEELRAWLRARDYRFRDVPYARFAAEKDKTNVVFYESGKLVVQGKGTREFIEFVLEPLGTKPVATEEFRFADTSKITRRKGIARFRYESRTGGADVMFGQAGDGESAET